MWCLDDDCRIEHPLHFLLLLRSLVYLAILLTILVLVLENDNSTDVLCHLYLGMILINLVYLVLWSRLLAENVDNVDQVYVVLWYRELVDNVDDVDHVNNVDQVYLVLWYRELAGKPLYSFDLRGRPQVAHHYHQYRHDIMYNDKLSQS